MSADSAATDPYKVLGLDKSASDDEIKKRYRELAKKLHPDLNTGADGGEDRFKSVSAAYNFLRDPDRRKRFDAGEIDATGAEMPDRSFYRNYAGNERYARGGQSFEDLGDIFSAFGDVRGARGWGGEGFESIRLRGADVRYHLPIEFLDAANGTKTRVTTPDGATLDITIPAGVADGQILRLAGKGQPGLNDGPPGDALIEISVRPHKVFERDGRNILLELPISIDEAVLGASVDVPALTGRVKLKIPPGSDSGRVLRVKGKGIRPARGAAGDLLVKLKIVMPDRIDPDLTAAMKALARSGASNPRRTWKGRQ